MFAEEEIRKTRENFIRTKLVELFCSLSRLPSVPSLFFGARMLEAQTIRMLGTPNHQPWVSELTIKVLCPEATKSWDCGDCISIGNKLPYFILHITNKIHLWSYFSKFNASNQPDH